MSAPLSTMLQDLKRWFALQQPVTKYFVLLSIILPVWLKFQPNWIAYLTFNRKFVVQPWRLLSCFFVSIPSVPWLMSLLLRAQYSHTLEQYTASIDHAFMLLYLSFLISLPNILYFKFSSLWNSLNMSILYVYARRHPNAQVSFLGGILLPAFMLPLVTLLWDGLLNQSWMPNLLGIGAAHIYWMGMTYRRDLPWREGLFAAPRWIIDLTRPKPKASKPERQSLLFRGEGRRLGSE